MQRLLIAAALSLLTAGSAMAQTVYIVRHGEKADASSDPVLSPAGEARAGALAAALADTHPSLILVSPLQRTRLTAAPTAEYHSLTAEAVPFDGGAQAQADLIAARIRALPADTTVLIVGHSNTVPLIARALGFGAAEDMPECEYDRMTVVTLNGDVVTGDVSRYGEATVC